MKQCNDKQDIFKIYITNFVKKNTMTCSQYGNDIFIFNNPLEHGHFHSSTMCQKFIGDHPFKLAKALISQYGNRPPEQIMCVPEETVKLFMEQGGKRGEPT